jgi:hypothetical protein
MMTKIVGIQYYQGKQSSNHSFFFHYWIFTAGLVGAGEEVILARQPHNEYDRSEWFPSSYRPKINRYLETLSKSKILVRCKLVICKFVLPFVYDGEFPTVTPVVAILLQS